MNKSGIKEIALKALKKVPLVIGVMLLFWALLFATAFIIALFNYFFYEPKVPELFNPSDLVAIDEMKFSIAAFVAEVREAIAFCFVGAVLVARYGWWNKKLFVHIGIWYAIYLAISLSAIFYEGYIWGILGRDYFMNFVIENSILPLIIIFEMVVLVAAARGIKRLVKKH